MGKNTTIVDEGNVAYMIGVNYVARDEWMIEMALKEGIKLIYK